MMKHLFAVFAVVLAVIPTASAKLVHFTNCTGVSDLKGEILSIEITPCDQEPCVLKKGSNVSVVLTFMPEEAVTKLKIVAYAIFGSIPFPLPLPNPNACVGYGLLCPLKSGVPVEMKLMEPIEESFPTGKLKLKVALKDQNSHDVICEEVELEIA